jgi:hypothetical protein
MNGKIYLKPPNTPKPDAVVDAVFDDYGEAIGTTRVDGAEAPTAAAQNMGDA